MRQSALRPFAAQAHFTHRCRARQLPVARIVGRAAQRAAVRPGIRPQRHAARVARHRVPPQRQRIVRRRLRVVPHRRAPRALRVSVLLLQSCLVGARIAQPQPVGVGVRLAGVTRDVGQRVAQLRHLLVGVVQLRPVHRVAAVRRHLAGRHVGQARRCPARVQRHPVAVHAAVRVAVILHRPVV